MAFMIVRVVFLVDGLHWLIVAAGGSENAEGRERGQQPQRVRAHEWCLLDSIRAGNGRMRSQPRWINARESEVLVDRFRRGRRRDEAWSPRRATGRRHGRSRRSHRAAGAALRRRAEPHLGHERRRWRQGAARQDQAQPHQQGKATGERISGVGGGGDVAQLRCDRHRGERDRKQTRKQQPGVPGSVGGGGRHASNDTNSIEPSRGRVHPNSSPSWVDTGGAGGRLGSSLWSTTSA